MSDATSGYTVRLPESLAEQARILGGERDLSAYVIRALNEQLRRDLTVESTDVVEALHEIRVELRRVEREKLHELVDQLEAAHGPVSQERMDELREEWHRAALEPGVQRPPE